MLDCEYSFTVFLYVSESQLFTVVYAPLVVLSIRVARFCTLTHTLIVCPFKQVHACGYVTDCTMTLRRRDVNKVRYICLCVCVCVCVWLLS